MKKNYLLLLTVFGAFTLTLSSCTKEQQALKLLNGTWKLESQRDSDGDLIDPLDHPFIDYTFYEQLVTFFDCQTTQNEACTGTTKTTTKYEDNNGDIETDIQSATFEYQVFEKSQLVIGGTVYEIDDISKKSLTIHPVEAPLATKEYSKQ